MQSSFTQESSVNQDPLKTKEHISKRKKLNSARIKKLISMMFGSSYNMEIDHDKKLSSSNLTTTLLEK